MLEDHFGGVIPPKATAQGLREKAFARGVVRDRKVAEITHRRVQAELLKGVTRAQDLRRPIELRIGAAQQAEQGAARPMGKDIADALLIRMEGVTAVTGKKLVASIAR